MLGISDAWFTTRVRWLVWLAYVLVWSRSLLIDNPIDPGGDEELGFHLFLFSKIVHVGAYAVFAALSGWLRPSRRLRWALLLLMSLHAFLTEYCQRYFETRHPSWRDVALDHCGIAIGIALTWNAWRQTRREQTCSPTSAD